VSDPTARIKSVDKGFDPEKIALSNLPFDVLKLELEVLWSDHDALKAYDSLAGGFSTERHVLMDQIVPRVEVYEKAKRIARQLEQTAKAYVWITSRTNDDGRVQKCATAECDRGSGEATSWGVGEKSIRRSLWQLSEVCDCGAVRHVPHEDSVL